MSRPYLRTNLEKETESFEAFECVAEALENIDSYERSKDKERAFLDEARKWLDKALEADKDYFKAKYFLAIVSYLEGETQDAITKFHALLPKEKSSAREKEDNTIEKGDDIANEIRYNLAAAYSEARQWNQAIKEFKQVIRQTKHDLQLRLLARAGLALTYKKRRERIRLRDPGHVLKRKNDLRRIEIQYVCIQQELQPEYRKQGARPPKGIDKEAARQIKQIMAKARGKKAPLSGGWRPLFDRSKKIVWIVAGILLFLLFAFAGVVYLFLYVGVRR